MADIDLRLIANRPFYVADILTSAVQDVIVPAGYDLTIAPTGVTTGTGGTASAATAYVVACPKSVTLINTLAAGAKAIIWALGGEARSKGKTFTSTTDGVFTVQLQAVGEHVKVQLICVPSR